jgi:hypothetical protein
MSNFEDIEPPRVSEIAQRLIFNTLWSYSSKKSLISGLWLREYENTPLFPNCFLHVLPVDKFRYFKYYLGNIILVTPGERGLWLQGTEEERIQYALDFEDKTKGKQTVAWNEIKRLEASLTDEYKKVFPSTVGMIVGYKYSLHKQKEIIGKLNKEFIESLSK